jgi:hypothetical protein
MRPIMKMHPEGWMGRLEVLYKDIPQIFNFSEYVGTATASYEISSTECQKLLADISNRFEVWGFLPGR